MYYLQIFFLSMLLLVSGNLHSQVGEYYKSDYNTAFLEKFENLKNTLTPDQLLIYTQSVLDTLPSKNIELKLALIEKKAAYNYRFSNYEQYYKCIMEYQKLAIKSDNEVFKIKSDLIMGELYFRFGNSDKYVPYFNNVQKKLTPEIIKNSPEIPIALTGFKIEKYKSLNQTENLPREINYFLSLINNIDTSKILNYTTYSNSLITYADFIDAENQNESYKYYVKSNQFANKHQLNRICNFSRIRIAGCLMNQNQLQRALDTLKLVSKSNTDLGINYLNYHSQMLVFDKLNLKDSSNVYKLLFEVTENALNINIGKIEGKLDLKDAVVKVQMEMEFEEIKQKIITYTLLTVILFGLVTTVYISKSLKIR